jgi:hypothetical protein
MYVEFIQKLITFFPSEKKLVFYKDVLEQLIKINDKMPAKLFFVNVAKHSTHIFNNDESYFLNSTFIEDQRATVETLIKQQWVQIADDQKEVIWFFLNQLLLMCLDLNFDGCEENEEVQTLLTSTLTQELL